MSQSLSFEKWTKQKILTTLETYRPWLQTQGVCKLGLFGSFVRGTANPESDMDFLAEFESPSFDTYMETKFFLEDLFECDVDLVLESTLKPRLRPYILAEVAYVAGL